MTLHVGTGQTQTAVSLMPRNLDDCVREMALVEQKQAAIDILEWRLDYWQTPATLLTAGHQIAACKHPVILTLRTTHDGGLSDPTDYLDRYTALLSAQIGDVVDIEWSLPEAVRKAVSAFARANGYQVLLSHHDLKTTPDNLTLQKQLAAMHATHPDMLKLATTAQSNEDTTRLMAITQSFTHDHTTPLITMAMSEFGLASRIFGGQFGSAVSFGYLEHPSAPGQLPIEQLKGLLTMHQN